MELVKQSSEIWESQGSLKDIERAARVCYKSEDKITEDDSSAIKLVENLIKRKHYAMLEFGKDIILYLDDLEAHYFFVRFLHLSCFHSIDFLSHDCHNGIIVIINPRAGLEIIEYLESDNIEEESEVAISFYNAFIFNLSKIITGDRKILKCNREISGFTGDIEEKKKVTVKFITNRGVTHELVRHREWKHIFELRCDKAAHPQMRDLMIDLQNQFVKQELI